MLLFAMDTPPDKLLEQIEDLTQAQPNRDADLNLLLNLLRKAVETGTDLGLATQILYNLREYYIEP